MLKASITGGATIWARQTVESEIFMDKPDKWFKIWFYLVNRVNHKDNKRFKRGECFLKYDWISDKTGASKNEIDHCVRWLKSATQIATHKARRGMVVKVLKYDYYQTLDNYYGDIKSDTESEIKAKQKRHSINKNDKNEKNDYNKKKIILHSKTKVLQVNEINSVIEKFKILNPNYERLFANKTQRGAVERLIKKMGKDKLIRAVEFSATAQKERYAPTITTPLQLEEKMAQLLVFYQNNKPNTLRKA